MVRQLSKEEDIDMSYYENLAEDAIKTISQYGDFNKFISISENDWPNVPDGIDDEIPFA